MGDVLRGRAARGALAAVVLAGFAVLFTRWADSGAVPGAVAAVQAVAVGLLLAGRHWAMGAVCAMLLVATVSRF